MLAVSGYAIIFDNIACFPIKCSCCCNVNYRVGHKKPPPTCLLLFQNGITPLRTAYCMRQQERTRWRITCLFQTLQITSELAALLVACKDNALSQSIKILCFWSNSYRVYIDYYKIASSLVVSVVPNSILFFSISDHLSAVLSLYHTQFDILWERQSLRIYGSTAVGSCVLIFEIASASLAEAGSYVKLSRCCAGSSDVSSSIIY